MALSAAMSLPNARLRGGPGRTRTSDLRFRKPLLCPAELRDQVCDFIAIFNSRSNSTSSPLLPPCYHFFSETAAANAAALGAQFRSDIEGFVTREAVEACISWGERERAPSQGIQYAAFIDPSGGSADGMTLAIAHKDNDVVILDALREVKPPFSPEAVVIELAALLKSYRVTRVSGDRYAGE